MRQRSLRPLDLEDPYRLPALLGKQGAALAVGSEVGLAELTTAYLRTRDGASAVALDLTALNKLSSLP